MTTTFQLNWPRRIALAIGLPFAMASIAFGAVNYVALVGRDSFRVLPSVLPPAARIAVGVGSGNITVAPSQDGRAYLSGVVEYSIFRPRVSWKITSSGTVVTSSQPRCDFVCSFVSNLSNFDYNVTVPPADTVNASSGSGNVQATNLSGPLNLSSGSGNLGLAQLSGPLVLSTGSGNINASGLRSTKVGANDGSGDVDLEFSRAPDQVKISGSSGNITVTVPAGVSYHVVAHTSSGNTDVAVDNDPSSPRFINLNDGSGNITVARSPR